MILVIWGEIMEMQEVIKSNTECKNMDKSK